MVVCVTRLYTVSQFWPSEHHSHYESGIPLLECFFDWIYKNPFSTSSKLWLLGRIIHCWKGLDEEIAALLESKETVQYWWRNSVNKFDNMDSGRGIDSGSLSGPLGGLNCDVRLPEMFHRLCEKGDRSFIWKSMQRIQESWVNIRLPLISFISFLPHIGFWSHLVPTESCFQGESNAT